MCGIFFYGIRFILKNVCNGVQPVCNANAEERLVRLETELAKNEDVTESLKRQDQMVWVQRMNSIRDRVFEIVSKDIVYH